MTRNELWNMLKEYSVSNGFPNPETFAACSKIPVDTIRKVYKLWIAEGKMNKVGDTYVFTDNAVESKPMENKPVRPVQPKVRKISVKKHIEQQTNFILKIIKIIAVIIASVLTCVSIHFTFGFNKLGMNSFWGFLLSASVVSFMAFAFTIKSYVAEKSTGVFIVILWVLGISYSVFTAVSGQYNDFRKYSASDTSVQVENKNKIYENQLKAYEKKQKELLHWREQETEYSLNPDLKTENPVTWKKIQEGVEELKKVENEITEVQKKLLDNMDSEIVMKETVYNWLAGFLGINADIIQFIIILFPALFIDLCSTVCFTFALGKEKGL